MIDLTEWAWNLPFPTDRWVKVLMQHDQLHYIEGIGRLNTKHITNTQSWTLAPGQHIHGPIVAWRELHEGEKP